MKQYLIFKFKFLRTSYYCRDQNTMKFIKNYIRQFNLKKNNKCENFFNDYSEIYIN